MIIRKEDSQSLMQCIQLLMQNQVIVVPCDTIYGFVGRVPVTDSLIRKIKGRGEVKPFLTLISSSDISRFSDTEIPTSLKALWPGPMTLIVELKEDFAKKFGFPTLAVRFPDDPYLQEMISQTGGLLYSTSVNRSGFAPMSEVKEIEAEFGEEVGVIVDAGEIKGQASTLIDITSHPYRILRQGALKIDNNLLK